MLLSVTIQTKATEQYIHACGAVYDAVRGSSNNYRSADEAQVFDHSNESNLGVLSCSADFWYSPLPR